MQRRAIVLRYFTRAFKTSVGAAAILNSRHNYLLARNIAFGASFGSYSCPFKNHELSIRPLNGRRHRARTLELARWAEGYSMMRIMLAAAALTAYLPTQFLLGSSHLQQLPRVSRRRTGSRRERPEWRETVKPGIVIFEDKFTAQSGGWSFGSGLVLAAPGAKLECDTHNSSENRDQQEAHWLVWRVLC